MIGYDNLFDLLVLLLLAAAFIIGYIQGIVRRLLGIAATIFSVIVAAQLRGPVGDFLVSNWTQFPEEYSRMLGFGLMFIALSVTFTIVIEAFYERSPILPRYPMVDAIGGGVLGVIEGILFIAIGVMILDSYFRTPVGIGINNAEFTFLRDFYEAIDVSRTAELMRTQVIPILLLFLGGLFPQEIRDMYPRT